MKGKGVQHPNFSPKLIEYRLVAPFYFYHECFSVMLRGRMHRISNASIIFLFNILYAFSFIKVKYFECWNKHFEEKTRLAEGGSGRWENNNKKNKSRFYFPAVGFRKQWPKENFPPQLNIYKENNTRTETWKFAGHYSIHCTIALPFYFMDVMQNPELE